MGTMDVHARRRALLALAVVALLALVVGIGLGQAGPSDSPPSRTTAGTPAAVLPMRAALRATAPGRALAVPTPAAVATARRYAGTRQGRVSFAVIGSGGRLQGLRTMAAFPSASLVKAMLLAALLRRPDAARRALTPGERGLAEPMIRRSDNDSATAVLRLVGDQGLTALARRVGMRGFSISGSWAESRLNAADQARFFRALPRVVPARHLGYARQLLSSVVPEQSWGIPRAARPRFRVFFKGGWRPGALGNLVHQAARLESRSGASVLSLAVLSDGNPSHAYGTETVRGVATRLCAATGSRA